MAKPKSKPDADRTSEDAQDRERILRWARKVLDDPNASGVDANRASDSLMRVTGLAVKPQDPQQVDTTIDQRTAERLADLAERMLKQPAGLCAECQKRLTVS